MGWSSCLCQLADRVWSKIVVGWLTVIDRKRKPFLVIVLLYALSPGLSTSNTPSKSVRGQRWLKSLKSLHFYKVSNYCGTKACGNQVNTLYGLWLLPATYLLPGVPNPVIVPNALMPNTVIAFLELSLEVLIRFSAQVFHVAQWLICVQFGKWTLTTSLLRLFLKSKSECTNLYVFF